jgi:hypothetical protein
MRGVSCDEICLQAAVMKVNGRGEMFSRGDPCPSQSPTDIAQGGSGRYVFQYSEGVSGA